MQLHEKYRPTSWGDVVGQDSITKKLQRLARAGRIGGRAYWLAGSSGTGKTTIARLIGAEVAAPEYVIEMDAGDVSLDTIRRWEMDMRQYPLIGNGRAYVINEAHGLRRAVIRRLLILLESLPDNVAIVFTTTQAGQEYLFDMQEDTAPLLSRCIVCRLTSKGLCRAFAERAREIARLEGLDGKPITAYERALKDARNNLRAVLQAVDAGEFLD